MSTTTNYGWSLPTVGADDSAWGGITNTTTSAIDAEMFLKFNKTGGTFTGVVIGLTPSAGGSGYASFRLPHGAAPTTNITNGDFWSTTSGFFGRVNGATHQFASLSGGTYTGPIITVASGTGAAGFNLPPGTAPTSPNNGDLYTTSTRFGGRVGSANFQVAPGLVATGMARGTISLGILTTTFTSGVITGLTLAATGRITFTRSAAASATDWFPAPTASYNGSTYLVGNYLDSVQTTTAGEIRFTSNGSLFNPDAFTIITYDRVS